MNIVFEYIKYWFNAKGRHGTHSPFVYDLVDNCLSIPIDLDFKKELSLLSHKLRSNKNKITIKDLGVGSKRFSNERSISSIFKTSSSKGKYSDMLYRIASHYKPKRILEFGTSLGIGTIHMSKGCKEANITTVEACPATYKEALINFSDLSCENINAINSSFSNFIETNTTGPFDLIFIDGHHDGEALNNYIKELLKFSHNETIFILDDIRWSNSMFTSWNELVSDEKFHVSIDLFRMGILIPRAQQVKEHFILAFR